MSIADIRSSALVFRSSVTTTEFALFAAAAKEPIHAASLRRSEAFTPDAGHACTISAESWGLLWCQARTFHASHTVHGSELEQAYSIDFVHRHRPCIRVEHACFRKQLPNVMLLSAGLKQFGHAGK